MATMLPNIALFAETEQRGTLNPLCLVAASDNRATRELAQSSWMATMGVLHGYYVAEYRIICRDGARGTLNPLCLMAASDNRATRELVQSSWMAMMGYCMATTLPSIARFAETGQRGTRNPL